MGKLGCGTKYNERRDLVMEIVGDAYQDVHEGQVEQFIEALDDAERQGRESVRFYDATTPDYLPNIGVPVWGIIEIDGVQHFCSMQLQAISNRVPIWVSNLDLTPLEPTHWHPIPAMPAVKGSIKQEGNHAEA